MQVTERLRELADKIASEEDHEKFAALVKEFNELLEKQQQPKQPTDPAPNT